MSLAQLVERRSPKPKVVGSMPTGHASQKFSEPLGQAKTNSVTRQGR